MTQCTRPRALRLLFYDDCDDPDLFFLCEVASGSHEHWANFFYNGESSSCGDSDHTRPNPFSRSRSLSALSVIARRKNHRHHIYVDMQLGLCTAAVRPAILGE